MHYVGNGRGVPNGESTCLREVKQFFVRCFFFSTVSKDQPYHLLDTIAFQCTRICSRFCVFPVREKVDISAINAYAYFCG